MYRFNAFAVNLTSNLILILTKTESRTLFKTFLHTTPGNSRHLFVPVGYAMTGNVLDSAQKKRQ